MRRPKYRSAESIFGGTYLGIPHQVLDSPNYVRLTPYGCKLLLDVGAQFSGANNGNLAITFSMMKKRGWKSSETLWHAQGELEHFGFIERTRQGGRNCPNLFALTWRKIDECRGTRLEAGPTERASNLWKTPKGEFIKKTRTHPLHARNANSLSEETSLDMATTVADPARVASQSDTKRSLH